MARVEPLRREDLTEFDEAFALTEQFMGFVPNSMPTMARVPGLLPAFQQLAGNVMLNGLVEPELVQLVALASSMGSGCRYCQAHTSHSAHRLGASEEKLASVWTFETSEHLSDAERAAIRIGFKAGQTPNAVTDDDIAAAKEHFDDDQIAAIVAAVALFGYLNRWNDTMATTLEETPTAFGTKVLADGGWTAGNHA